MTDHTLDGFHLVNLHAYLSMKLDHPNERAVSMYVIETSAGLRTAIAIDPNAPHTAATTEARRLIEKHPCELLTYSVDGPHVGMMWHVSVDLSGNAKVTTQHYKIIDGEVVVYKIDTDLDAEDLGAAEALTTWLEASQEHGTP